MADVAIVVGHHPQAPGAALTLEGMTIHEYQFWQPFAKELVTTLWAQDIKAALVERPNPDPDQQLARKINDTDAECAVELHFNSFDGSARGTEMLYWANSADGKRLAHLLHDEASYALETGQRGLKSISSGYPFLRLTEMPAVICEPAFGSTSGDAWKLLTRQCRLLKGYRNAITAFLDGEGVV